MSRSGLDIACPWCYVGKRRFEAALAQFEHAEDVRVTWRELRARPDRPEPKRDDRAERRHRSTE